MNLTPLLERLTGDEKHDRSAHSTLDVLAVLYGRVLRDDDRFLLSKGHGPQAFYAVLAAHGLIDADELDRFGEFDSILGYHPDRVVLPAATISSGSLGHGLGIAVGMALAAEGGVALRPGVGGFAAGASSRTGRRVFVLVGDAELDEGSNWEAIQFAGRIGLRSLTVIVIDNASATYGWPGGIATRFDLEGWDAVTVDGRDHEALETALSRNHVAGPVCVVAEVRR